MSRILSMGASTLISGGVINNGSVDGYISDSARRALGLGFSEFSDGGVGRLLIVGFIRFSILRF